MKVFTMTSLLLLKGTHEQIAGCQSFFRNVQHDTFVRIVYRQRVCLSPEVLSPERGEWLSKSGYYLSARIHPQQTVNESLCNAPAFFYEPGAVVYADETCWSESQYQLSFDVAVGSAETSLSSANKKNILFIAWRHWLLFFWCLISCSISNNMASPFVKPSTLFMGKSN